MGCFSPHVGVGGHAAFSIRAAHHHWRHRGGRPAGPRHEPELDIGQPQRSLQWQLRWRGWSPWARGSVCPPVVTKYTRTHTRTAWGEDVWGIEWKRMFVFFFICLKGLVFFRHWSNYHVDSWHTQISCVLGLICSLSEEVAVGQPKTLHYTWNTFHVFKQQIQDDDR